MQCDNSREIISMWVNQNGRWWYSNQLWFEVLLIWGGNVLKPLEHSIKSEIISINKNSVTRDICYGFFNRDGIKWTKIFVVIQNSVTKQDSETFERWEFYLICWIIQVILVNFCTFVWHGIAGYIFSIQSSFLLWNICPNLFIIML